MAKTKPTKPFAGGYISNPLVVLQDALRAVFKYNAGTFWGFVAVSILTIMLAALAGVGVIANFKFELGAIWIVLLLAVLIIWAVILLAAFTKYALQTSKGQEISFKQALGVGYQKSLGYVGLMILTTAIVLGGLVLFIIPGLIFMYWFLLAPYIYMDQDVSITEALRQSKKIAKAQPAEIVGVMSLGIALSMGSIIPVFGFLYSIIFNVVWYVAWSYRYLSAQELLFKKRKKPTTHPLNYWSVGIALASLVVISALGG